MTTTEMLDMSLAVARRQCTWRFDLLDTGLENPSEISIIRNEAPTLRVDVSRATKRTLDGVRIPPDTLSQIDVIKNRLKLTMLLEDGTEHAQGVFMFSSRTRHMITAGMFEGTANLSDQLLIVDQQLGHSFSIRPGRRLVDAVAELLDPLPIVYTIEPSGAVVAPEQEEIAWDASRSRLAAVNEILAMLGYHELYFDNHGVGRMGPMPNPEAVAPETVLSHPAGTYLGSLTIGDNLLELPNRFVVVNSGASQTAVYGVYDLPDSAPHSIANRGFVIPKVVAMQGIEDAAQARVAARAMSRDWRYAYEIREYATAPDPRHDHYNVTESEGERLLELGWSCPLEEGAEMRHVTRRTYEEDEVPT